MPQSNRAGWERRRHAPREGVPTRSVRPTILGEAIRTGSSTYLAPDHEPQPAIREPPVASMSSGTYSESAHLLEIPMFGTELYAGLVVAASIMAPALAPRTDWVGEIVFIKKPGLIAYTLE